MPTGLGKIAKSFWRAFFGHQPDDTLATSVGKVAADGFGHVAYQLSNWWLGAVNGAIVVALDVSGVPIGWIFLAAFAFDLVVTAMYLWLAIASGRDVTLGSNVRRGVDTLAGLPVRWRLLGHTMLGLVIVAANTWNGPEQIVMMIVPDIKTRWRKEPAKIALLATGLTLAHSLPWMLFWMGAWRAGAGLASAL